MYEFLRSHSHPEEQSKIKDIKVSEETETTIEYVKDNRTAAFKLFEESAGFHIFIEGDIAVKSIDPQNIDALPGRLLHQNYVKLAFGNDEILIQQPVVSYYETDLWQASKLHVIVETRPVICEDKVRLDGIGEIREYINLKKKDIFSNCTCNGKRQHESRRIVRTTSYELRKRETLDIQGFLSDDL